MRANRWLARDMGQKSQFDFKCDFGKVFLGKKNLTKISMSAEYGKKRMTRKHKSKMPRNACLLSPTKSVNVKKTLIKCAAIKKMTENRLDPMLSIFNSITKLINCFLFNWIFAFTWHSSVGLSNSHLWINNNLKKKRLFRSYWSRMG